MTTILNPTKKRPPDWETFSPYFCYFFWFQYRPSNLLVAKLTSVPSAAVSIVCNTSPSDILAQMEQIVPPRAEMRISFIFIHVAPFCH